MKEIKDLRVLYRGRLVGRLALYKGQLAAFEYDQQWIKEGFSISPFSLPLESRVFIPRVEPFDGLYGVFADSLPDGWGRLLVDRLLLKHHVNPCEVGIMDRLAIVGGSGMGALTFEPDHHFDMRPRGLDLDQLAEECGKILQTDYSEELDDLFRLGGSSGGARPKILTQIDGEEWIIKFPASGDDPEIGVQEYDYSICAKACGIEMEETRLFPSKRCGGYFGTRRFDREKGMDESLQRIHMISASALLETSHRIPNLDYDILMKLTLELTKDFAEAEKLYRLMCFNVFAHNRDDHSKNFTYLYDERSQKWRLSPAYDLTYSYSLAGEHATTVHGEGKEPQLQDILKVAHGIGMNQQKAREIAEEIRDCVYDQLGKYMMK